MEVPKANCDGRPLLVDLKREVDLVQLHTDVIEKDVDDEVTMFRLMQKPAPIFFNFFCRGLQQF